MEYFAFVFFHYIYLFIWGGNHALWYVCVSQRTTFRGQSWFCFLWVLVFELRSSGWVADTLTC